jgi:hypothetical protein
MHSIASLATLFDQAPKSIREYFEESFDMVEQKYGKGSASQNPELVGRLTQSMAIDFGTSVFRKEVQALAAAVNDLTSSTQ